MSQSDTSQPTAQDMMASMLGLNLYVVITQPVRGEGIAERLKDHLNYQIKLEQEGKLFGAGPMFGEDDDRPEAGLIILRAKDRDEARALADADPFHSSGLRSYTLKRWKLNEGSMTFKVNYSDQTMSVL
ncbi:hypothetical protein EDD53_2987 [Pacificibacter maritimus]|uniref:YCII-related domain-containing protein n=1 Tax=Pacificibacter maritimus TaxID=762213 RepID=A0A3N4TYP8_9RHOB|nr:YciI family protein [Pacificibacter maritimus]RPE62948.1 hypothetical protein EDD53_2987 [Pacificibacter maritimus]